MKIKLVELRKIIKTVMKEAQGASTISAQLDPNEKEYKSKFEKSNQPVSRHRGAEGQKFGQDSPARVKTKQVAAILQKKGLAADAEHKKKITQMLPGFIEKIDPQEMFTMDADELATMFSSQVLGVNKD
jgi:hypothetical protein